MAKKNDLSNYMRLSSAGIQMGVVIALAAWGGSWLDDHYQNEKPIWTIVCSLSGVGIGLYLLIKEVLRLNKQNEEENNKNSN